MLVPTFRFRCDQDVADFRLSLRYRSDLGGAAPSLERSARPTSLRPGRALARRQIELTRETFEGFSALLRDLSQPVSPEDRIAKNTDYAKQMLEKGVNHGREVVTIAAKAGAEAAEVLQKRATESLDEMRAMASKTAA